MAAQRNTATNPQMSSSSDGVQTQILATEHWSLLAARSMTWSEVMSRITIHLTIMSACLVVLALVAQASGFGMPFRVFAIGIAAALLILGTLTGVRVNNASIDDGFMLQGMNRLRAGYVELHPEVKEYFVTSHHDDQPGVMQTYLMGAKRAIPSHILASTNMYMHIVNAITAGVLGALVANTAGAGTAITTLVGILAGILCLLCWIELGRRSFAAEKMTARFPTKPQ